ncbi:Cysteine protease [Phytophthora megakarya]|uniref:Cysteine protease n=1 Tax=Phytophthora megakarya TaxID=4795 RepID=A0A225VBP3_9STRA|nr:Cysteine protease [Phytophthora megakarya]
MLVDAIHNTNEFRYKLFSFMIHDVYGHENLLRRENTNVGVVDPVMCHLHDRESKLHHISQGGAFNFRVTPLHNASNDIVVLAMHVDGNHWCGIVFDFRVDFKSITIFDPLQAGKSKFYDMCENMLQDLFEEKYDTMQLKKETKYRQPDVANCG